MSFAHETKSALAAASLLLKHDCCKRSELYGILYSAGVFSRERLKLVTTCEPLAELCIKRIKEKFSVDANLYITEKKSGDADEKRSSKITVPKKEELSKIFRGLKYEEADEPSAIKEELFKCASCRAAFVRGVFLTAGTVTDPDKGYHLEMSFISEPAADAVWAFLDEMELAPKRMVRKTENVLYYKDSESIENFLAFIGANNAAFAIMNKKIEREIRSDANRLANSELANIGKTVAAAGDQLAAINALVASGDIDRLPDELKITANLRLMNPDATLLQLAAMHEPPITKSGVNHRLKKIVAFKV